MVATPFQIAATKNNCQMKNNKNISTKKKSKIEYVDLEEFTRNTTLDIVTALNSPSVGKHNEYTKKRKMEVEEYLKTHRLKMS